MSERSKSILIVGGCGTFGLSTAWHLSQRGYTNIICLDRWSYPSKSSAGYDRNKIVRTAYAEPIYVELAQEAIEGWNKPMFKNVFKSTGWILGTRTPNPLLSDTESSNEISISAAGTFDKMVYNVQRYGQSEGIEFLPDPKSLHDRFPHYFSHTPDFRGIFDSNAGWVDASKALEVVGKACEANGVKFVTGTATSFVWSEGEIVGVKTEEGTIFEADKLICCLGAYTDTLIDMQGQLTAVAYSTTHVQLTPQEQEEYRDMPVVLIEGLGYTFPPDADGRIKFCDLHVGHPWMRTVAGRAKPVSIPRDAAYHESDTLPDEDIAEVRAFIRYCMPQFAERKFVQTKMCWDTESFDFGWIIDYHPSSPNRLLIATGGSGHSFKNLPNVGKYIADRLEDRLGEVYRNAWRRWRPDKIGSVPALKRVDLADLHGWKHEYRARL
ncbi:hypothetical protein CROQUDRAFT_44052 [Cronartium quercuum f. sp. fusiforme G11]|uniref:FAD dependent oxidoreductase domain-containing protein n=1 Tax=Cronartium quercuum f. sp. fusiforme G11 TaxID=708437 RepID=A0A9P6TCF3_9BASI|nr:hypothetical protein CROQUDRAFT_44052 [Cronartium quercuum f. sp. fusiforme G11]